jgi:hypothetical protein
VLGTPLRHTAWASRTRTPPRDRLRRAASVAIILAVVVAVGLGAVGTASGNRSGPVVGIACTTRATRDVRFSGLLGNRLCRVEFDISTPAPTLDRVIGTYARAGIRVQPLAGFQGRLPTESDALRLRSWALRFGPGGTFWNGRKIRMPVLNIEFGNETSYSYQYDHNGTWSASVELAARARVYAVRAKSASIGLRGTGVGLLVQAEDGNARSSVWVDEMFAAVPDLAGWVSGWTIHPYGEGGFDKIDRMIEQLAAHGAPSSIPIFITEWGLASENGRALTNNYGYPTDMTYAEAATTLRSVMARWKTAYGSRIAEVIYYMLTDLQPPGTTTEREPYFGALKVDGSRKGEYTLEVRAQLGAASAPTTGRQTAGSRATPSRPTGSHLQRPNAPTAR